MSETETRGTYVFDIRSGTEHCGHHLRRLVVFAQHQLLREVKKRGFDVLLTEGYGSHRRSIYDANGALYFRRWTLTLLRKGKHQRAEVQYIARGQCEPCATEFDVHGLFPAAKIGKPCRHYRPPPFMEVLYSVH